MTGGCHCGAVTVSLRVKPGYVNDCNCSFCSSSGALWGYFSPSDVLIEGNTKQYARKDREVPGVAIHFCETCGATTHWSPMPLIPQAIMGANMRLFDPSEFDGIEHRFPNGRAWDGKSEFGYIRDHLVFGTA